MLFKYLREGFPRPTIFFYVSLLVLNWMISTYCAITHLSDPRAALVRIFYSFDLFFAVFAPVQMILYAYHQFHFDSAEFAVRMKTLDPGNFDVTARLFADPSVVSHFRTAFRSLQLSSGWSLTVKVLLNVFTIQKWWRTIRLLGDSNQRPSAVHRPRLGRVGHVVGILFFGMGAAVFIYTVVSVISSQHVCQRFVYCKAPCFRWNVGSEQCSCSVFVDRVTEITTIGEWEDPVNSTANLAALAATGDLKVIQIINRQLPTFPEELRRCHGLEQLILIYTKTITIPTWTKELSNLEYLHLEGDYTNKQIQVLPRNLLQNMPKLAFLHLGCLRYIPFVPDLDRIPNLNDDISQFGESFKTRTIDYCRCKARPYTPANRTTPETQVVEYCLSKCYVLQWDMNPKCDLTTFSCRDRTAMGEPRVECVHQHISPQDQAVVNTVGHPVCEQLLFDVGEVPVTFETTDHECGGVIYRRCMVDGVPGICYPARMMVLMCNLDPSYETMRRTMIERGVGTPCDPVEEAWLGCPSKSNA